MIKTPDPQVLTISPGLDPTTMQQCIEAALSSTAILAPLLLIFSLLPIGLIVLAVGIARAGILA